MGPEVDKMASVMQSILGRNHLILGKLPDNYRADHTEELIPSRGEAAGLLFAQWV